jgi:coenzyme PQQ precursor peptide PqqA
MMMQRQAFVLRVSKEVVMTWTTPEFQIVELGMEVGAYAGNA